MKCKIYKILLQSLFVVMFALSLSVLAQGATASEKVRIVAIEEFIQQTARNDTEFEEILIDELALQYEKDLKLPAGDIVLDIKGQYDLFLSQSREEPETTFSLSKLFPYAGTSLSAAYKSIPSFSSTNNASEFEFSISQPIAENAFGKATRLRDKIIGVEIDVTTHQIVEAYEDYLATIFVAYYDWYEAYENLEIGKSSYAENLKLLENIKERQQSKIALPIDVNKINIQVLAKKEKLVSLQDEYDRALNIIVKAMRYEGDEVLVPVEPAYYDHRISFQEEYEDFKNNSRTYHILDLLEKKSSLEVDKNADDLLPSINLLFGYTVDGDGFGIRNEDNQIFAGVSLDWPLPDQVERAEYETARITADKSRLTTKNTHYRLYTDLKNLYRQMEKEKELLAIADEKIELAREVVIKETENYSFGKVTLNDFIRAVNVLDENKFSKISHSVQLKELKMEWLRLSDRLINKKEIEERHQSPSPVPSPGHSP